MPCGKGAHRIALHTGRRRLRPVFPAPPPSRFCIRRARARHEHKTDGLLLDVWIGLAYHMAAVILQELSAPLSVAFVCWHALCAPGARNYLGAGRAPYANLPPHPPLRPAHRRKPRLSLPRWRCENTLWRLGPVIRAPYSATSW